MRTHSRQPTNISQSDVLYRIQYTAGGWLLLLGSVDVPLLYGVPGMYKADCGRVPVDPFSSQQHNTGLLDYRAGPWCCCYSAPAHRAP